MSVARIVFGTVVSAVLVSAMGCKVEVTTKTRFVEQNVAKEDTTDWAGQPITVDVKGVGISVNGGVEVVAVPNLTKVRANARLLAMAFSDEKPNADQSIVDAKATYVIENTAAGITVRCGHGQTHGSSAEGESGCEHIKVEIPAGSAQQPLDLKVFTGSGDVTLNLQSGAIKTVGLSNNGLGATIAELPATPGASVELTSHKGKDITIGVPAGFAADKIWLQAQAGKIVNNFPDAIVDNTGGRGAPGTGFAILKATSVIDSFGDSGTVTLR